MDWKITKHFPRDTRNLNGIPKNRECYLGFPQGVLGGGKARGHTPTSTHHVGVVFVRPTQANRLNLAAGQWILEDCDGNVVGDGVMVIVSA